MEQLQLTHILLLVLVLIVLTFVAWFIYKQIEFHLLKLPPGPIGLPILGYAPFLSKENMHEDVAQLNKKYGKIFSMTAASLRVVFVSDFDTAKELLCHPNTLFRPPQVFDFVPGRGGFSTMNGKSWTDHRRIGMQAMRNAGLGKAPWNDIILEDVVELIEYISATNGKPMDIDTLLNNSSMKNILALLMGRQFQQALTKFEFEYFTESDKIFKEHFQNFALAMVFPWLIKYFAKFNVKGYAKKTKVLAAVSEIIRNEIRKRLNSEDYDPSADYITQFMEEVKKYDPACGNIEQYVECCLGNIALFTSGSVSAMTSTHWILYFMAAYPEKQARVHAELDEAVGRNGIISWDNRDKLPYSMACLMEMERWVTVIPIFPPRSTTSTFEFHGYTIAKGTIVIANGWALNRDPKYWDKPDEYMPERFLQTADGNPLKMEGYAPFSFGKRNCPGEKITMMISFLYFTGILQRFSVRTPSGEPPDLTLKYCGTFEPISQPLCFTERE